MKNKIRLHNKIGLLLYHIERAEGDRLIRLKKKLALTQNK